MKCGADIDIKDKYGYTPLFNAISKRHVHCAELLLYEDASPNHSDNTQGIR
jgi:ankyrin repeat protein